MRASWSTSVWTCSDDLARVRGELDVGGEELGVVEGFPSLRLDEAVEPALEALGCRSLSGRDRFEGFRDALEPALGDGVAKRGLARKVAVDASMADAKGAGDVDDVRLRRPVAAEDLLRRFEDALSRERLRRHVA